MALLLPALVDPNAGPLAVIEVRGGPGLLFADLVGVRLEWEVRKEARASCNPLRYTPFAESVVEEVVPVASVAVVLSARWNAGSHDDVRGFANHVGIPFRAGRAMARQA